MRVIRSVLSPRRGSVEHLLFFSDDIVCLNDLPKATPSVPFPGGGEKEWLDGIRDGIVGEENQLTA
jgi:hypothetical protein